MLTFTVVLASIAQAIVSLFVYLREKAHLTNKLFLFIGTAMVGWSFADYLSIIYINSSYVIYFVRIVLFFVVIQNTCFYIFGRSFPDTKWRHSKRWLTVYIAYSALAAIATISPFVFTSFKIVQHTVVTTPGPAILIFVSHALISIIFGFRGLIKRIHNSMGKQKAQVQLLLFASILNWILVPITNFAVTQALKTALFVTYSPFYTLAFAVLIAYAIVAQKLFDIRAAVTRSVGYVLFLGLSAAIYGIVLFGIINILPPSTNQNLREIVAIVLLPVFILSFQNLKKYTDRLTNKLFYRESYEIQEVLDELGDVVVDEIDLHKITSGTKRILSSAVKPNFIEFILFRDNKPYLEPHNHWKSNINSEKITNKLKQSHKELLVVDELPESNDTKHLLKEYGIALSLRLKTRDQIVGYILFGNKNSGDSYYSKDRDLLEIVANELSITIQNALRFEEIQKFNLTLQYKIEDATQKLRKANLRLKKLDEIKDDFISISSHQLRTPLTSIKGYLTMVLEGDAGKVNKDQNKFLNEALISSKRMTSTVTDLLNISRLDSGKFTIDPRPTDLVEIVKEIIQEVAGMASYKNIQLVFKEPKSFPHINVDTDKITQVVMNFIDNAIHYTNENGKIEIKLEETDDTLEFTVTDNGIGVPAEAQKHLFTKFYRAENAQSARPDGTGIGLYLAKQVISAQSGDIIFYSEENKGSTFGFSFPKAKILVKDNDREKVLAKS